MCCFHYCKRGSNFISKSTKYNSFYFCKILFSILLSFKKFKLQTLVHMKLTLTVCFNQTYISKKLKAKYQSTVGLGLTDLGNRNGNELINTKNRERERKHQSLPLSNLNFEIQTHPLSPKQGFTKSTQEFLDNLITAAQNFHLTGIR